MDGGHVWASTLAQLMAKSKPQDVWELVFDENLVFGHVDGGGFQYRLRGLSRLQCGLCQWGWSSAHVHVLFHLWWDQDSHLGLVKMRLWGQRCQLCPPEPLQVCQVSLLNVRLFLHKLVLFILHSCYHEGLGADQGPEVCFGDQCEACELGVCFFQKPPDPAWGPEVRSCGSPHDCLCGSGPVVLRAPSLRPRGSTMPDLIINPLSESNQFFSENIDIVTVPFSLACAREDRGHTGPAQGLQGPLFIGRGSIYLPAGVVAAYTDENVLVHIMAPIFHGKGRLLSSIKPFQVLSYIFRGRGFVSHPIRKHREGAGAGSGGDGGVRPAPQGTLPVSYIIGLTEDGDGCLTLPSYLAHAILGPNQPPDAKGSLIFSFVFTDKHRVQGGRVPFLWDPEPSTRSRGFLTIPRSVLRVIRQGGMQGGGYLRSRRHRRPRVPPEPDSFWYPGCSPYEEAWIWLWTVAFILWVIYECNFGTDHSQRRL